MEVYRLTKTPHANDLTGAGAEKFGARWNPKGTAVLYTASSRALAALEYLVHLTKIETIPRFCMLTI